MEIELKSAEFCLKDNHPLSLRSANGLHITCTDGILWITMAGESEDIFLTASQGYRVNGNGLVIIESIGNARFQLDTANLPRRTSISQRFQLLLSNVVAQPA